MFRFRNMPSLPRNQAFGTGLKDSVKRTGTCKQDASKWSDFAYANRVDPHEYHCKITIKLVGV